MSSPLTKKLTKPCSLKVPSVCGVSGASQVTPPSVDRLTATSYANIAGSVMTSQCDAHSDSVNCTTDGKSARLTNQLSPFATVTGLDQRLPSQREYSRATVFSPTFIQLNIGDPLRSRLKLGETEFCPAGDDQSANVRVSLDCSAQDPAASSRMIITVNFLKYLCMIFNRWVNKTNIHAALSAVEPLKQGLMQPDYPRTKGRVKQVGPPSPLRLISNPL